MSFHERLSGGETAQRPSVSLQTVVRQMLKYAPGVILPAIIGLLMAAILTRTFSTAEYGQYNLVVGVTTLLAAMATQWLQQGIGRYLPSEERSKARLSLKGATALAVAVTVVVLLAGLGVFSFWADRLLDPRSRSMFWAGSALVVCNVAFSPLTSVLQAEMQAGRYAFYQFLNAVLRFGVSLGLVFCVLRSPVSLVWGSAASFGLLLPFMWRSARMPGLNKSNLTSRFVLRDIGRIAGYGLPMLGWFVSANILNVGDRYLLEYFRGSSEVGIYAANYGLVTGAVGLVTTPVLLAAQPFLMRAWGEGDPEAAGRWLGTILVWFLAAGAMMIGCTWLFAGDIARFLLGPAFREGYPVIPVVLAGSVAFQASMYVHKPLEFAGKTALMFKLSLFAAVSNVMLNLLLIPRFGYMAAAYTTLTSYVVYVVLAAWAGRNIVVWQVPWRQAALTVVLTGVSVGVTHLLRQAIAVRAGYVAGLGFALLVVTLSMIYIMLRIVRPLLIGRMR